MVRKNNPVAWMFYIYPLVFPRGQTYAFAAERAVNRNPFKTNRDLFFICFAPCKGIQHSLRFWIPRRGFHRDSRYSGFQSFSVDLVFWIPILSGIQVSLSCMYSEFHKPNFPDSGISDCLTCDDLLNMFPCFLAYIRQSQNITK